jgi:tetratricopeptide (TPR) repeat protein
LHADQCLRPVREEDDPGFAKVGLAAERNGLGERHPLSLDTLNGLAQTYQTEGKYEQAEALFSKALESERPALGEAHPDSLRTLLSLGHVQLLRQKYTEAAAALRETLTRYEKALPESWERYNCQSLLGAALAGQKKFTEAESLLLSGFGGMVERQAFNDANHRSSLSETADRIVKLYEIWGKPAQAAEWRLKLEARGGVPGR